MDNRQEGTAPSPVPWERLFKLVVALQAQVVWAVRHPMDVAMSCFAQPFEGRGTPWAWDLESNAFFPHRHCKNPEQQLHYRSAEAKFCRAHLSRLSNTLEAAGLLLVWAFLWASKAKRDRKENACAGIAQQIELTHAIMEHWKDVFLGRVLEVKYEQLVEDQEAISRRLLAHCDLGWDPNVLMFHETSRHVQTASLTQARFQVAL